MQLALMVTTRYLQIVQLVTLHAPLAQTRLHLAQHVLQTSFYTPASAPVLALLDTLVMSLVEPVCLVLATVSLPLLS